MGEDLKDSITQAFKERLSSPLWGYILFSWIGFNWENLAKLFMSSETVEERIKFITSQDFFYIKFILFPVLLGTLLAILSPYLQQWLSVSHKRAEQKQREGLKRKITDKYDDDIEIADKKIAAHNAEALAKEKEQTKIILEQEKQKREKLDTKTIEEKVGILKSQQRDLELSLSDMFVQKERAREELEFWRNKASSTIEIISAYSRVSDSRSINKIKDELNELFSKDELEVAGHAVEQKAKQDAILKNSMTEAIGLLDELSALEGKVVLTSESGYLSTNDKQEIINSLTSLLKQMYSSTLTVSDKMESIKRKSKLTNIN